MDKGRLPGRYGSCYSTPTFVIQAGFLRNMASRRYQLPLTGRDVPDAPSWLQATAYLLEAGAGSVQTEATYRSALRLFADWLQHTGQDGYTLSEEWPLDPARLTTATLLNFRGWLLNNRSRATATTYMAALTGYLNYLDGQGLLPPGLQLGKLQRQLSRRPIERNLAETVLDLDDARQAIPQIIAYYDRQPLPPGDDPYNRRLSLLRNRALVHTLYSTAAPLGGGGAQPQQRGPGAGAPRFDPRQGQQAAHYPPARLRARGHSRLPRRPHRQQPGALCGPQPQRRLRAPLGDVGA